LLDDLVQSSLYTTDVFFRRMSAQAPQTADNWLALDKLEHVVFCAVVVAVSHYGLKRWCPSYPFAVLASFLVGLLAGCIKEFGDFLGVSGSNVLQIYSLLDSRE
jgi:hypothetical protein